MLLNTRKIRDQKRKVFSFGDDKGDSNVTGTGKSNVTKEMLLNKVKEDFTEAFEKKSDNGSSKESLEMFQKGDHVLVAGVNRKFARNSQGQIGGR